MNVAWGLLWRGSRSNVIAGLVRRVLRVSALRSYMVLWKPWLQNALQWLHECCMLVLGRKPEHETFGVYLCKVTAGGDEGQLVCAAGATRRSSQCNCYLQRALDARLLTLFWSLQYALDATVSAFPWNLHRALDARLLTFFGSLQHALDATVCAFPWNLERALDARLRTLFWSLQHALDATV